MLKLLEKDKVLFNKFKSSKTFDNIVVSAINDSPYVYNEVFLLKENINDILDFYNKLLTIYNSNNNMLVVNARDAFIIDECLNTIGSSPEIHLSLVKDEYLLENSYEKFREDLYFAYNCLGKYVSDKYNITKNDYKSYPSEYYPGFEYKECILSKKLIDEFIDRVSSIDIKEYIKNVQKGEFEKNRIIHEIQKEEDSKKEFMLLGLRKIDGLKISEFKNKFGDNPIYLYRNELKKLSDEKLIIIQDDNIRLSNKGIDLANLVWEEFV